MATHAIAFYPPPPPPSNATKGFNARADQEGPSDDALVALARVGETDALAKLIERHYRFCLSKAYSILHNRGDAEDEVQTAWMQVCTHLDAYQRQGSFSAWLGRIVSNQCLMRLRKARQVPLISVNQTFDSEGSFRLEVIDQRALAEEVLGDNEVSRVLVKEIRAVPPLLRDVLVMRDVRHLVMRDIAATLGISIPAAKSRLMRGRLELRQRLAKHHGDRGCGILLQKAGRKRAAYVRAS
jgi:RNA polymerase sigma-70 factor (ECF subfamily)